MRGKDGIWRSAHLSSSSKLRMPSDIVIAQCIITCHGGAMEGDVPMCAQEIQRTFYKVTDFLSWQKAGNLDLSPKFQRRAVWKEGAKSYLIDTMVRGFPIPIIFLREKKTNPSVLEPRREVVDGQQRLRTVISYINPQLLDDYKPDRDSFTVKENHNPEIAGKLFSQLSDEDKSAILDYQFNVHVLPSSMDDRQIIQIFRRMNSTSYKLSPQELRNAEYYGYFKTVSYKLAAEQLQRWRDWKTFTEDQISRMQEVELTSECLIMMLEQRVGGKSSKRIDNYYKDLDTSLPHSHEIERRFTMVMETINAHFFPPVSTFVFFDQKLIYTFFSVVYELLFGHNKKLDTRSKARPIMKDTAEAFIELSNKIGLLRAPSEVLKAIDRRTTNPKERKVLFDYILKHVANA